MTQGADVLWIVPRARLADSLRMIASLLLGIISLGVGFVEPWILPLAVVLVGYAVTLGIKMVDRRPAIVATREGLKIFRFPGASHEIQWNWLVEVTYLKMRVKRVLFFKVQRLPGDTSTSTTYEMPSTDFSGKGREIVRRLTDYRDQFA